MVTLLGALALWAGYTVVWDGGLMLRGYSGPGRPAGPGILDLILPSRVGKVVAILAAGPPGAASGVAPGSTQAPNGTVTPTTPTTNVLINPTTGAIGGSGASPGPAPPSRAPGGGLIPPGLFGSG